MLLVYGLGKDVHIFLSMSFRVCLVLGLHAFFGPYGQLIAISPDLCLFFTERGFLMSVFIWPQGYKNNFFWWNIVVLGNYLISTTTLRGTEWRWDWMTCVPALVRNDALPPLRVLECLLNCFEWISTIDGAEWSYELYPSKKAYKNLGGSSSSPFDC